MQSATVNLRTTRTEDLKFVLSAEQNADNNPYVSQWTTEQHLAAMTDGNFLHLVIEDRIQPRPVGYIIIAGKNSPHRSLELRRIVVTDKGRGFGREALRIVKRLAFEQLGMHRLWLDVRQNNDRARRIYKTEGFSEEGIVRDCVLRDGKYNSLVMMSILEGEYFTRDDDVSSEARGICPRIIKGDEETAARIRQGLVEYNTARGPQDRPRTAEPIYLVLRGEDDEVAGGLTGEINHFWRRCHVEIFWIAEKYRRFGYGADLLAQAEEMARKAGCEMVYLETYSFQAPGFYRKYGYELFGTLETAGGYNLFFFKKSLKQPDGRD